MKLSSPDAPTVAVVILNWNGWEDTRDCLESLQQVTYPRLRVLLVDNGSTDGSVAKVREAYPQVEVIDNGANLGFAAGNNRGMERALADGADHVMLLNNDTVVEPGFVEPLLDAAERTDGVGFASPTIMYADDPEKVWFAGSEVDWRTGWVTHAQLTAAPATSVIASTPTVTGCCLLAPRGVWESVGLLDERFFLIWEDADWSMRARRAGHVGIVVGEARIRHKVSASFQRSAPGVGEFYFVRNGLLFIHKHARRRLRTSLRFLLLWVVGPSLREARRRERFVLRLAALRAAGVVAHLLRRYGVAPRVVASLAGVDSRRPGPGRIDEAG